MQLDNFCSQKSDDLTADLYSQDTLPTIIDLNLLTSSHTNLNKSACKNHKQIKYSSNFN